MIKISKVIIWGHKLHSHTHSYIHGGFYKAFKHLGYNVYWIDETDKLDIDFSNCLFITEGQVEKNIPINNTSYYVLHNCSGKLSSMIKRNKKLNLQTYTKDAHKYKAKKIPDDVCYYLEDCIMMPWATDLLPDEIDKNINNLDNISNKNIVNFVGMLIEPWIEFKNICIENNICFYSYGGFTDKTKSFKENEELIKQSIIAPSLQNSWQVDKHYIPCRIFKNISYGKMGITNSLAVNNFFDNKLIYSDNIKKLFEKSLDFEKKIDKNDYIKELMIIVRDNHTYINRIKSIFWLINNSVVNL